MNVILPTSGIYVIAVSGGVDSMALLHILHQQNMARDDSATKLIVAHLDHGIRDDSYKDRRLVQQAAREYGLPFVYHELKLGPGTSEAAARKARYHFLRQVMRSSGAEAIITAHHQDDVLETAIINILRGSGRKGMTSLGSRADMLRPLLHVSKQELIAHAEEHKLQWREDSTNQDVAYLRNYVRHKILPRFDVDSRERLVTLLTDLRRINHEIDETMSEQLSARTADGRLDRQWFIHLPHAVARDVMASWLRSNRIANFDKKMLERLVIAAKVGYPGTQFDAMNGVRLTVWADNLALEGIER